MSKPVIHKTSSVLNALGRTVKAHQAVREGIATHAEKHQQVLDEKRESARHTRAINDGIAKQSQTIQGNS